MQSSCQFPAVTFRPLNYRHLEKVRISWLKYRYNNFEIQWWISNIDIACQHIVSLNPDIWDIHRCKWMGAYAELIHPSRGPKYKSAIEHTNAVELRATEIGIWKYCSNRYYPHIRVMCDNMIVTC